MEANYTKLAEILTGFSTDLQAGERVLIDAFDIPEAMTIALVRAARARGAIPYVQLQNARIGRELVEGVEAGQFELQSEWGIGANASDGCLYCNPRFR
jgi:aminopeptidase